MESKHNGELKALQESAASNATACNELKCDTSMLNIRLASKVEILDVTSSAMLDKARSTLERQNRTYYLSNKKLYKLARKANAAADQELGKLIAICENTKYQ